MLSKLIARHNRKANNRAFTLIELLVVILILGILMAVALPLYLQSIRDAEQNTNMANMKTISNAVQAERVRQNLPDYSSLQGDVTGLVGTNGQPGKLTNLQYAPKGPQGSEHYVVVPGNGNNFTVTCTGGTNNNCAGASTYDPANGSAGTAGH